MKQRSYVMLLILLGLSLSSQLMAQPTVAQGEVPVPFDAAQARFEKLTVADGLPENSGTALLQDHLGFIWIGTQNGLARFDGQTMITYEVDPDDPYSFAGLVVTVLEEDHIGDLWIGTIESGLIHYERASGRFTSYTHDPEDDTSISSNWIHFLHADRQGNIWVGVGGQRPPFKLDRLNRAALENRTGASSATNAPPLFTRLRHNPDVPGTISHDLIAVFPMSFSHVMAAFLEDDAGTIWVGTLQGGLNRYNPDTQTFKAYQHDANNPNSLGSNDVRSVVHDREGNYWIGTISGGLSQFDPNTEIFTHYRHDPNNPQSPASDIVFSVYEDLSGALWLSTDLGLSRYDPRTTSFKHFLTDRERPGAPREDYLYPIAEDQAGIWFLSRDSGDQETALHYYDKATESFTYIVHDPDDPTSLSRFPFSFLRDRSGTIWVGSGMQGVNKLDTRPRFPLYTHVPDDPNSPSHRRVFVVYEPPSEPGILWIGTEAGLDRWDRTTGQYTHYRHRPDDPQSLAGWVNGMVEDQEGQFWVKTSGGLQLMDRTTGRFTSLNQSITSSIDLSALTVARDGTLWIAGDGLTRLDPQTGEVKNYRTLEGGSYHPDLYEVLRARAADGDRVAALLQVGDDANLTQAFSLEAPTALLVVAMAECLRNQCSDRGWIEDEAGDIVWEMPMQGHRHAGGNVKNRVQAEILQVPAGTYRLRYHSDENHSYAAWNAVGPIYAAHWGIEVQRVPEMEVDSLDALLHKPNEEGLLGNLTSTVHEDRHGNLWVGTFLNGLNRFDPETETFTTFFDPRVGPQSVRSLYEDRSGRLWMADGSKGLHLIDPERGSIRQYTTRDGLPSNIIVSITEDDAGKLWLGTGNGIVRFDPDLATSSDNASQFRTYGAAYGLQQEALSPSAIKSADGTLFFAGQGGVNAVDPVLMADNPVPPEVALTGFDLFNASAPIGPDAPLATDVTVAKTIVLAHDENDFTFHFTALHYARPEENTVAYKLEPYEDAWIDGGTARSARYTNLSPGVYLFRVKAASPDGVWNEEGRSIRVVIRPPWWRTLWAYSLYGFLALGSGIAVYRIQRRQLIAKERERARERELAQAREIEHAYNQLKTTQSQLIQQEKMASLGALTAGIAHEIKNPLNFINNFAEVNAELADELEEALANGDDITEIIDDLRQNATVIAQHGKRADGIVKSMMAHAHSGSGEKQQVDLNALVNEHVDLAYHGKRATTPGYTVAIERGMDAAVGEVLLVPQDIGRVVLNLLSNAFDAVETIAKPRVTVSTMREDGHVVIRVADNGPGIPDDIRAKVFEPFFTTKPTGHGTGLGLSLSYEIVTLGHGGTMDAGVSADGGALFEVSLPV